MEIKEIVEAGLAAQTKKLDDAIEKFEGQLKEKGKVDSEVKAEVKELSEQFAQIAASVNDLAQKQTAAPAQKALSAAEEFVNSQEFKEFASARSANSRVRLELKNTILADSTTTTIPDYRPGVVPGAFRPLTIRDVLPQYTTSTDLVVLTREASFTNNADEQTEGQQKAQSALTFNKYNVPVETVAHWLKVSRQLMQDAPAVVSYIETRLRFGVEARIDAQLLNGNGTSPNISGLLDSGNFTAYTPTSGDNLIDAINRAKYQLWATGYMPDAVIVNPADWGAMEIEKGTNGHYLYSPTGMAAGMNPFGVRVVLSSQMAAGNFLIGQFAVSTGVWNREGTVIEMGYDGNDFTSNLVTVRAEARLGLEVSVPAALLGGEFSAS